MTDHATGFVQFLAEPSRRRVKTLLELGEKRRGDLRGLLSHAVRLEPRFSEHITGKAAFAGPIAQALRQRGAPEACYVLSSNSDLDGREMPLDDALQAVVGAGEGTFISCIPGKLGFYEFSEMKASYLLFR